MASTEDIAKSLADAIGANDDPSTVSQFLTTGYPELDYALSNSFEGGLPCGRVIEIAGPPSSGKTAIATWAMAQAQRMGGIAGFNDHERSFSTILAPRLGLDTKPGRFIFKKPETFEESVTLMTFAASTIREKKLIKPDAPICWVFDSLAAMVPYSVLYDPKTGKRRDPKDRNMRDNMGLAMATSQHLPAIAQIAEDLNICVIFLNQIRTKPGVVYGDPRYTPGGNSLDFYASIRLMLGATKIVIKGEAVGLEVTAVAYKNKVARPFRKATWRFMFQEDGTGKFDIVRSTVDFLVRQKALEMSGAYVVWEGKKLYPVDLAKKIEADRQWNDLLKFLPKAYEPEVVASVEIETGEISIAAE